MGPASGSPAAVVMVTALLLVSLWEGLWLQSGGAMGTDLMSSILDQSKPR